MNDTLALQSTLVAALLLGLTAYIVTRTFERKIANPICIVLAVIFVLGWLLPLLGFNWR